MPLMIDSVRAEAMLIIKISSPKNTVCNCRQNAKVIVAEQQMQQQQNQINWQPVGSGSQGSIFGGN